MCGVGRMWNWRKKPNSSDESVQLQYSEDQNSDEYWVPAHLSQPLAHTKGDGVRLDEGQPNQLDPAKSQILADHHQVDDRFDLDLKHHAQFDITLAKPGLFQPLKNRLEWFRSSLAFAIETEVRHGTLFHLVPLAMAAGIVLYFRAGAEPYGPVVAMTLLIIAANRARLKSRQMLWQAMSALLAVAVGYGAAILRTQMVSTQMIGLQSTAKLTGTILKIEQNQRGKPRYLIKPDTIVGLDAQTLPQRVRLTASSRHETGKPGDKIAGLARLLPLSGPAYPGGYDFSFHHWYRGLGATGFFMGAPHIVRQDWSQWPKNFHFIEVAIHRLRSTIAQRIRDQMQGSAAPIAVALITGERTAIPKPVSESLRKSGLAHILAISGLHMALVSLSIAWLVRMIFATHGTLSETMNSKTIAITAGFGVATLYLLISGNSIATQRAWLMISIIVMAAIMRRRALTLRGVAVAAILLLALWPESLFSPGFQMSFAAVAAIVAGYDGLERHRSERSLMRLSNLPAPLKNLGSILITSLLAGSATAMFAAYHFQNLAPLGLLSNLLAVPLVTFVIMPLLLAAMFAMPYGVEGLFLDLADPAIRGVVGISDWVNDIATISTTGLIPTATYAYFGFGFFLICMLQSKLRLLGIPLFLVSAVSWKPAPIPDILLSEDGRAIAVKSGEGLGLLYPRRNKFITEIWLKAYSNAKAHKLEGRGHCDRDLCVVTLHDGQKLYVVYDPDMLLKACKEADILLAPRLRWVNCREGKPGHIIRRGNLEQNGSHVFYLGEQNTVKIVTALDQTTRPWRKHRQGLADYLQD